MDSLEMEIKLHLYKWCVGREWNDSYSNSQIWVSMTTTHPRPPCWGGNTPLAEVQKNDVVIVCSNKPSNSDDQYKNNISNELKIKALYSSLLCLFHISF